MRIKNTSEYDNKDLKNFIYEVGKQIGLKEILGQLEVEVKNRKKSAYDGKVSDWPSGAAYIGKCFDIKTGKHGYFMTLRLPPNVNKRRLAFVVSHELLHCAGFRHRQIDRMRLNDWKEAEGERFAYADNLPLNPKKYNLNPPKPKRDLKKERYEKALKMVKYYQIKLKRTTTLLKKWQRKVKYYEKSR
jgi:hypothetical protein